MRVHQLAIEPVQSTHESFVTVMIAGNHETCGEKSKRSVQSTNFTPNYIHFHSYDYLPVGTLNVAVREAI